MTEIEDIIEKINDLKKSRKKLYIVTYANLIFGLSLVTLFITSFTEFGIFRDTSILIKLFWLLASAINFYAVTITIPTIKRSKEFISETIEELHLEDIC